MGCGKWMVLRRAMFGGCLSRMRSRRRGISSRRMMMLLLWGRIPRESWARFFDSVFSTCVQSYKVYCNGYSIASINGNSMLDMYSNFWIFPVKTSKRHNPHVLREYIPAFFFYSWSSMVNSSKSSSSSSMLILGASSSLSLSSSIPSSSILSFGRVAFLFL